ncbi:MAG TPA: hypothetical protein VMV86_04665 [Methanosarcinales archaeon]|nr:hypothetical protein [Methanosarcinales archaeon]
MTGITVVVCGDVSEDVITLINRRYEIETIGYGGVKSSAVLNWALRKHLNVVTYPCDYHKHGDKAIFVQHYKLLRDLEPDLIVIKASCGMLGTYVESISKDMNFKALMVK